jgi:hypothetical protein
MLRIAKGNSTSPRRGEVNRVRGGRREIHRAA